MTYEPPHARSIRTGIWTAISDRRERERRSAELAALIERDRAFRARRSPILIWPDKALREKTAAPAGPLVCGGDAHRASLTVGAPAPAPAPVVAVRSIGHRDAVAERAAEAAAVGAWLADLDPTVTVTILDLLARAPEDLIAGTKNRQCQIFERALRAAGWWVEREGARPRQWTRRDPAGGSNSGQPQAAARLTPDPRPMERSASGRASDVPTGSREAENMNDSSRLHAGALFRSV